LKNYAGVALSDESGGIFVNFNPDPVNGLYEAYTYGSDTLNRLYVHVKDHTAEDIYFGFNVRRLWFVGCGTGNATGDYTATSGNVVYWRLRDPNGVAVDSGSIAAYNGGTAASTAAGYIGNYTQAANGPDGVDGVGTAGYTPETYNPTANGDYYFEFNYRDQTTPYNASSCTRSTIDFQYFDITIVGGTSSIKGRLWSRQWSLVTVNRAPNQAIATNSSKIHVYTDDSIITRVDFDTISPGNWNIIANENGIGTSGNFELDVRSTSSPATELNRKK